MGYASRTGTRRNLAALRDAGWRLLVSAKGALRTEGFRYALDNGAWTAFQRGEPFDAPAFDKALALLGDGADWVVCPDVVGNRDATLAAAREWLPRLSTARLVLIAAQDGMSTADLEPMLDAHTGVFFGGGTEWKLRNVVAWGQWCKARGTYFHVARVNSAKRIRLCQEAQADSFDGSSASRFALSLGRLARANNQLHLLEA